MLFTLSNINSPYLNWNHNNPEVAFMGIFLHIFEWILIRMVP